VEIAQHFLHAFARIADRAAIAVLRRGEDAAREVDRLRAVATLERDLREQ
jgi:hypothetical protein